MDCVYGALSGAGVTGRGFFGVRRRKQELALAGRFPPQGGCHKVGPPLGGPHFSPFLWCPRRDSNPQVRSNEPRTAAARSTASVSWPCTRLWRSGCVRGQCRPHRFFITPPRACSPLHAAHILAIGGHQIQGRADSTPGSSPSPAHGLREPPRKWSLRRGCSRRRKGACAEQRRSQTYRQPDGQPSRVHRCCSTKPLATAFAQLPPRLVRLVVQIVRVLCAAPRPVRQNGVSFEHSEYHYTRRGGAIAVREPCRFRASHGAASRLACAAGCRAARTPHAPPCG